MSAVFLAVILLLAGWGVAMVLRERGPSSIADLMAVAVGVMVAGSLGAALFGEGMGLIPTALTVLVGLVMLLAVRSMAPQAGRPR
jgi:zinc transporter ZupT